MSAKLKIWRKSVRGRFLMFFVIIIIALLSFILSYRWFDELELSTDVSSFPRLFPTKAYQTAVLHSTITDSKYERKDKTDQVVSETVTFNNTNAQTKHNKMQKSINDLPFHFGFGRLDNSRKYRIHEHVMSGTRWPTTPPNHTVCLVTIYSLSYFHHFVNVIEAWNGIASVTLWVPGKDLPLALSYIQLLRTCYQTVRDNCSFHVVYPVGSPPQSHSPLETNREISGYKLDGNISCKEQLAKFHQFLREHDRYYTEKEDLIPQNLLRNVGRKACPTEYTFVMDGDLIPQSNLSSRLTVFLRKKRPCPLCAYVIPAYEIYIRDSAPQDKHQLMEQVRKKKARPFKKKVSLTNKEIANYQRWERVPIVDSLNALYEMVGFADISHDHFYVSLDSVPPYDERFIGYGYTRNTQVYETQLAGFKMWMLDTVFLIHKTDDFNEIKTYSENRVNQIKANADKMMQFRRELEVRYSKKYFSRWTNTKC